MVESDRAASVNVATVLTLSVVVVATSVFGTFYLDGASETQSGPTVDLRERVTTDRIGLVHNGGDPVATADLRVTVRVNGTEQPDVTWASGAVNGDGDGLFESGERRSRALDERVYTEESVVEIVVAETRSNRVIVHAYTDPTPS